MVELPISEHGHPVKPGGTNSPEGPVYPFRVFVGHIISSSLSNIAGVIAGHPFDTIKVSSCFELPLQARHFLGPNLNVNYTHFHLADLH
jgi:hypothetical protein